MQTRKFRQPTVREALREAREALGPDAYVLATEMVPALGWRGWLGRREVQLTAQFETAMSADRPSIAERRPAVTKRSRTGTAVGDPEGSALVARLVACGLDLPMALGVVAAIPEQSRRGATANRLFQALTAEIAILSAADDDFARAEVFVGPPGVGKTTTIAKIAARERAAHGRRLGMIAADGFRAGAVDQLRTYAEIIGSPFKVARTSDELSNAIASARNTVLVDTAGRSPRDRGLRAQLQALAKHRNVRMHLVMAADTSPASARRIFDSYAEVKPSRIIITKLDEAESLAPLSGLLREQGVPISYLTTGQRVPEDLEPATPAMIACALLREPLGATVS